jgi:hypothetical protein
VSARAFALPVGTWSLRSDRGAPMSKPEGKCAFCGKVGNLTKSHIWPDWVADMLPRTATHHEQIVGRFHTFVPVAKGPEFRQRIRQGHVGTRKPRNTCKPCNGGWMRHIEEAAIPIMQPLLAGTPCSLDTDYQRILATLLCLVSMRIERASNMKAIPPEDRNWLMTCSEPPTHWKIWIAQYQGAPIIDERYTAIQIASSPDVPAGVEHCNTQVTTLVIGQLCAHLFSSTVWRDFGGYDGAELASIWPLSTSAIDMWLVEIMREVDIPWLHETAARSLTHIRSD